jgi:UDP-glucose 4-epimerase
MRCLVTGAAGFIGSHLCEALLNDGHEVWSLDNMAVGRRENLEPMMDNERFSFFKADLCRSAGIDEFFKGVHTVFHLAARADIVPSIQEPQEYFRSNVTGTMKVLEAARKAGVKRLIYAASSSCYGIPTMVPTPESAEIRCEYPYALTKFLGEELVMHWGKVYGLEVTSLRLFNVYGPRARTSGTYGAVFGVFLSQLYHNKPLTVVGDGTQSRDFTHVRDVVRAFLKAAYAEVSGLKFNIGTGKPQTVNRLVELLGAKNVEHLPKRPGEPDITCASPLLANTVLGWEAQVSFEDGVQEMKSLVQTYKDAPIWTSDSIKEATKDWFKYLK